VRSGLKFKVRVDDPSVFPEDVRPLVKSEMSSGEVALLGSYLIKKKINDFKERFRGLFKYGKKKS